MASASTAMPPGLESLFDEICALIRDTPVTPELQISDQQKLRMYGLYKHVTVGPCSDDNRDQPSVFAVVARAKYQAWADSKDMTTVQAMLAYVELAVSQSHWLGRACLEKLEHWKKSSTQSESSPSLVSDEESPALPTQPCEDKERVDGAKRTFQKIEAGASRPGLLHSLLRKMGIQPLIPRGQLDISYRDLAFAAWQCLRPSSSRRYCQLEDQVAQLWDSQDGSAVITGLSVRSLLDLYLRASSYPADSEIIVTPPINIPGMIHVLQYHNLQVVPVDMATAQQGQTVVGVDVDAVKEAITAKTVAIMVVHPFGMTTTTDDDMKRLRGIATEHKLHIIEDCAECFTGLGPDCYRGSSEADISFFSFGTIKTATALGGGVAILRNTLLETRDKMNRMHHSLYGKQRATEYVWKVLWCTVVHFIADHPLVYGVIFAVLCWLGLDFDAIVSASIRSFVPRHRNTMGTKRRGSSDKERMLEYVQKLRKRPPAALLSLLLRRLIQSRRRAPAMEMRMEQCQVMSRLLENLAANTAQPKAITESAKTFWLFPIQVSDPDSVSLSLLENGFDVPRGMSQLQCISSRTQSCPLGEEVMKRSLYLPVASRTMSKGEMQRMAQAIHSATTSSMEGKSSTKTTGACGVCKSLRKVRSRCAWWSAFSFVLVALAVLGAWVSEPGLIIHSVWTLFRAFAAVFCAAVAAAIALRWSMADFYIESSQCFAKYNSMLFNRSNECVTSTDSPPTELLLDMDLLRIPQTSVLAGTATGESEQHRVVLLTGATGFIGRLLLRDLLLYREAFSIAGGVVVICRSKRGNSASDRISAVMDDPMYSFLSASEKRRLVRVVEGDVTKPDVGLSPNDVHEICHELEISHVIHCAAAVSFTQTLKEAAISNILSSLNMQSLTGRLKHKGAKYVHISTAFVHGGRTGTVNDPLPELLHSLDGFDAVELYRSMIGTQYYASSAMKDLGFPNTYAFSKCVCEHLLVKEETVPTIIIRPSIVGPAVQQPYEGWAGDKPTTIVAAACLYMSYQWNLWCFGDHRVPYIPVDVVTRFILAKAFIDDAIAIQAAPTSCESPAASSSDDEFEKISIFSDSSSSDSNEGAALSMQLQKQIYRIHTVAWDASSPESSAFTWIDYAVAVTHLGSVLGHFSRLTAMIGLFVTVRILPGLGLSTETFETLHRAFVQVPIDTIVSLFRTLGWCPRPIVRLSKLSAFLDLPLLFLPFMNGDYYFSSELVASAELDGERYLFSCAAAARNFLNSLQSREKASTSRTKGASTQSECAERGQEETSALAVGGAVHNPSCADLWWALTQPRGNFFVRLAGWIFIKVLRACSVAVTVDVSSFSALACAMSSQNEGQGDRPHVILAPNHRSFLDFILLSYICFAIPELNIEMPFIAAADDFERLPLFGWFARKVNAFFLRRGRGKVDPLLQETVYELRRNARKRSMCIEVFIEGGRSRDRRYLKPRTGLLRCLAQTGGKYLIVPISINYEQIPEQANLANELDSGRRSGLNSLGLFSWLKKVYTGQVNIGRVHVAAASPLHMNGAAQTEFGALAMEIQRGQQSRVCISDYHICASSKALGIATNITTRALTSIDCTFWPHSGVDEVCDSCSAIPNTPASLSEQWMALLHFGHLLSPFLESSHPKWCKWLNEAGTSDSGAAGIKQDPSVLALTEAVQRNFDEADASVNEALAKLRKKGFNRPKGDHVVQFAMIERPNVPVLLVRAAVSFRLDEELVRSPDENSADSPQVHVEDVSKLFDSANKVDENESLGFWGFRDSGFALQVERNGSMSVAMKGTRYSICGKPLKKLIPFIEKETKTTVDPLKEAPFPSAVLYQQECDLIDDDVKLLNATVAKVSLSISDRIRRGSGHSQEDMYLIRSGSICQIRLPDAVAWPSSEDEVCELVSTAKSKEWCLIPFGGGTNVSHATRCPTKDVEPRPIISVDMKLMNRILWINEEDGLAHVEAGITGRTLVEEMRHRGYTIGHEPDSIEFSTLGGWIATKASGMKRNKYGNIEDIVKSVRVAGSEGLMWRGNRDNEDGTTYGRESRGIDLLSVTLGSEGCLGIITSAVIRIWPLPECHEYESVIFPDFEHGLRFARDAARLGPNLPSSVRVLDNEHFRLGQALRGDSSIIEQCVTYLWKTVHPLASSYSPESAVCATIVFEGTRKEVKSQRGAIQTLASKHGGTCLGSHIGRSGYELTFAIAYLRDFAMTYNFLAESFETFAPWSKVESIVRATKERIRKEHEIRCLPGKPFIGSRVTQLYHEGACLYFYFCMSVRGVDKPSSVFSEIEHAARQEILDRGGSLSHHHGIGKIRAEFTKQMDSDPFHSFLGNLKKSVDPSNTFGARNGAIE